jgi:hypothetical protein
MAIEWDDDKNGAVAHGWYISVHRQYDHTWTARAELDAREHWASVAMATRAEAKAAAEAFVTDRADLARLRAIEAAAREYVAAGDAVLDCDLRDKVAWDAANERSVDALDALRAALAGKGGA